MGVQKTEDWTPLNRFADSSRSTHSTVEITYKQLLTFSASVIAASASSIVGGRAPVVPRVPPIRNRWRYPAGRVITPQISPGVDPHISPMVVPHVTARVPSRHVLVIGRSPLLPDIRSVTNRVRSVPWRDWRSPTPPLPASAP
jgi:hypothetical protein